VTTHRAAVTRRSAVLPPWSWALPPIVMALGIAVFAPEMTYAQFHLTFTLPWLALALAGALLARRRGVRVAGDMGRGDGFAWAALGVHAVIAFVYTTPWDNYLVFRGVWGYPEGRVLGTIGYVPVEEYAFFLIQTLGTGLILYAVARALGPLPRGPLPERTALAIRVVGTVVLLLLAGAGALALGTERGTYMGLITAWALPVVAFQWAFGGDFAVRRWPLVSLGIAIPTLYLWVADTLAIRWSIWWIHEELTLGWRPFGLPVEEAVFFLVTNVLVVLGLTIAHHPDALARVRAIVRSGRAWRPLLVLWALSMIPAPLVPDLFAPLAYVTTALLAAGVFAYAWSRYGPRTFLLFAVTFGVGLVVEAAGERIGVPFGAYTYTAPGPALLGVPLLVPLGWFAFTLVAIAVAPRGRALLVAPFALVAWDLGLDPLMVQQGFWHFDGGGAYLGVPLSNFLGWYLVGLLLVALLLRVEPRLADDTSVDLRTVYLGQAFLIGVGSLLFGLPLAAAVAVPAMLAVASTWWWLEPRRRAA
jgi:lycopene beta-cyclase